MELTGAQILLESLKKEDVDVLFGYPGGAVIDIYDELPRHPELKHVLVRHEQGGISYHFIHCKINKLIN